MWQPKEFNVKCQKKLRYYLFGNNYRLSFNRSGHMPKLPEALNPAIKVVNVCVKY